MLYVGKYFKYIGRVAEIMISYPAIAKTPNLIIRKYNLKFHEI